MNSQTSKPILAGFEPAGSGEVEPFLRWPNQQPNPFMQPPAVYTPSGWTDFAACAVCPDQWNIDFGGAAFVAPYCLDEEAQMGTFTLRVTMASDSPYPVKVTGYVFANDGVFLGSLDLRYVGAGMPRTLAFDIARHNIPASATLVIAFQISGGGPPRIPAPPLITSVSISLTVNEAFFFLPAAAAPSHQAS